MFCSPYPGNPWEGLNVTISLQYSYKNNDINGPEQGRKRKRNTTPIIVCRGPRGFGHHLVMGWTGAVPQGFQSTHQHPKRPHHCASWSRRLWLRNPRHLSLLRDTACYISRHLVLGVDGGGPDLGSGLMPGALVTHLNGERISLLTTSIYNRIVDPDPLDPDPPDTNSTDMSVILNSSASVF